MCLPWPSSSGSQELDGPTLPRCSAPYPLRGPSLSFHAHLLGAPCICSGELDSSCDPPSGCRPSRISRKSLVRSWRPVCSLVGDAISGAEFAPFPSSLFPASGGGWAGPQPASSSLELLSLSFVPKQCRPLLSIQPTLAGGRCGCLGYFSARSCF